MEFVGNCASTTGSLQAAEAASSLVLRLDPLIPGCDTLEALDEVRSRVPALAVLVVIGLEEGAVVADAFRLGARGIFLKTMDLADLTSVIRRVASGEHVNTGPKLSPRPGRSLGARPAI